MRLPASLNTVIHELLATQHGADLARAAEEISRSYRDPHSSGQKLTTESHRLAYLAVRLPATYAALSAVLGELALRIPAFEPYSLLDLGAGPGTGTLAAAAAFPQLKQATLVESDKSFIALGRKLSAGAPGVAITWQQGNLTTSPAWPQNDLVILGYVAGELSGDVRLAALRAAWQAAGEVLVIVEPGSVAGYETVLAARDWLLANGAHAVAPCPHARACPMQGTRDWCHFAARVERSSLHRRAKGGELPYEDEKFSYFIASRNPVALTLARIVARPEYGKGHVKLRLCTPEGLKAETVSKKQGDIYRAARKAEWGDGWESPP